MNGRSIRLQLSLLMVVTVLAQPAKTMAQEDRQQWVYGFMAPGFTNEPEKTAIWELGAGFERLVVRTLALRVDGAMAIAGVPGADFGFPVTLNAAWHFWQTPFAQRRWTPFITGGYTRAGFSRSSNMFNAGAGFNQWTDGCCGFRFELLHHVSGCVGAGPGCQRDWYLDARLGFVIQR
jgi:hypothetical protein